MIATFTLPGFLAGPAGAVLAALVLAVLAKGLHLALRRGADAAEVKFPAHKDEIEKVEQEAEKVLDDVAAAAKAPLGAAAKEVLSTGALSPQGQVDLKAAGEKIVQAEKEKLP